MNTLPSANEDWQSWHLGPKANLELGGNRHDRFVRVLFKPKYAAFHKIVFVAICTIKIEIKVLNYDQRYRRRAVPEDSAGGQLDGEWGRVLHPTDSHRAGVHALTERHSSGSEGNDASFLCKANLLWRKVNSLLWYLSLLNVNIQLEDTRMHSSRMPTVRCSGRLEGGWGVSA